MEPDVQLTKPQSVYERIFNTKLTLCCLNSTIESEENYLHEISSYDSHAMFEEVAAETEDEKSGHHFAFSYDTSAPTARIAVSLDYYHVRLRSVSQARSSVTLEHHELERMKSEDTDSYRAQISQTTFHAFPEVLELKLQQNGNKELVDECEVDREDIELDQMQTLKLLLAQQKMVKSRYPLPKRAREVLWAVGILYIVIVSYFCVVFGVNFDLVEHVRWESAVNGQRLISTNSSACTGASHGLDVPLRQAASSSLAARGFSTPSSVSVFPEFPGTKPSVKFVLSFIITWLFSTFIYEPLTRLLLAFVGLWYHKRNHDLSFGRVARLVEKERVVEESSCCSWSCPCGVADDEDEEMNLQETLQEPGSPTASTKEVPDELNDEEVPLGTPNPYALVLFPQLVLEAYKHVEIDGADAFERFHYKGDINDFEEIEMMPVVQTQTV